MRQQREAPNYDFRVEQEELRSCSSSSTEERCRWLVTGLDFVHEIQPGDIIVAKRGTNEIVGIGIVTSDCIPPKDSAHPFASDEQA